MNIIIFSHPGFINSQSMPRFTHMLYIGMVQRGHHVEIWSPRAKFYNFSFVPFLKKWLGYIDQYLVFPKEVKRKLSRCPKDALFVFTDHALGPWIPLVANKLHIIHCHDFLAQRSSKGEIPENRIGLTGKIYQEYIRKGFQRGKNFISVSERTRDDLHRFLNLRPYISAVVYNGMNQQVYRTEEHTARAELSKQLKIDLTSGYILHVGGNQWYKNRIGVISIYNAWREKYNHKLHLLMVGSVPSQSLEKAKDLSPYKNEIFFITDFDDKALQLAYSGAKLLLYPSLAEGFGWPIAEAMAGGCPVITMKDAPMTEVGGSAAFYISKEPLEPKDKKIWTNEVVETLNSVLHLSHEEREAVIQAGFNNIEKFDTSNSLDKIEAIYKTVLIQE